jgi:hypothetical protein
VALSSVLLLVIQAVGGLLFFSVPIFPFSTRARILPLHGQLSREQTHRRSFAVEHPFGSHSCLCVHGYEYLKLQRGSALSPGRD